MFSRGCQYAIRALVYLAERGEERSHQIKEIAERLDVPYPFLAKVTQSLVARGLVSSQKGPGGGVRLARDPSKIFLSEVVEAVDGPRSVQGCILGLPECGEEEPCPLHDVWGGMRDRMVGILEAESLMKLAGREEV
jgi:Rrf2 family transcriptional regulator, iron-sulfur cluster assembly transcription factor